MPSNFCLQAIDGGTIVSTPISRAIYDAAMEQARAAGTFVPSTKS